MAKVKCEPAFTQFDKVNVREARKLTVDGAEVETINPDHFTTPIQASYDSPNSFSMTGNQTQDFQIGRRAQLDSGQSDLTCNKPIFDLTPDDIFTANKYDYSIITAVSYDGAITDITVADSIVTPKLEEASVDINWSESKAGLITTTDLINSTQGYPSDYVLETIGFNASGDGGGAKWVQNGVTAQTPSQSPAQLLHTILNDASGNQWAISGLENNVKSLGVIGDGVTDDTAAATAAYKSSAKVVSSGLTGIIITSQLQIESTVIECGDTPFIIDYTEVGSGSAILPLSDITFDNITINLTSGNTFRRVISFGNGVSKGGFVSVTSDDQINNRSSTLDGAVQVRAATDINTIKTKNFDNGVVIYQHSGTNINNIICESYVRGCLIDDSQDITSSNISTYTASPNATQDPGHNGLLIENSSHITLPSVSIDEAGEHGVRIGGGINENSSDINFGVITSTKSGQCAFKANTDETATLNRLTIDTINSVDCATGSATGTNEDVCRLENVRDVVIGSINGAVDLKANCGNDGIYMTNAQRVTIGPSQFSNPLRSAIYIDDTKGQCRDLSIPYIHLNSCTSGTAVVINSPSQSIEHMNLGGYLRDIVSDQEAVSITASSPTGGVPNAIILKYDVDVSNFTSPGSVVKSDLITSTTTASRIYNEMTPRP